MGRLTKAPEIKYLQDDNKTAMARCTLAVDRRYGKDREREADFIPCVTFGKNAEFVEIYLKKGTKIVISGRIRTGSYEDFGNDAGFDIEKYLTQKLGKSFGKAEDNAFINGTGADEPTGILHHTDGAKTALTVETLTYDDVISLYFSVDKEYRKNGIWLMNDKTALALRKLKDNDGNYLWNQANDTILGKQVIISEYMPDIETGTKPIAFSDFSYYWIVGRKPVTVRTLLEKFVMYDQIGYLAFEFLDGKFVRNEAIKVIQMEDIEK